ncbi:MAG: sugar phosphate isomerase/epimerase [Candidatus Solibacter usitatus]|nr:sugar phosphate isomerase/epimerase [Candidatus Solibacter usitatus]
MMRRSYILMDRLSSFPRPEDLRRVVDTVRACGYDGIELNLTEPFGFDIGLLERWLSETGLVVPSFLTGEAYFDGLCLSSPDAEVRRRTVARLAGYTAAAERFHAVLVVGLLQGRRSDEPDTERARARIVQGLRGLARAAEARGVEVVVEPVNHLQVGFHNSVAEVRELIRQVGADSIRPMVDTVHMNIEEASLTQPILDCGAALRHVHLCESNGGRFGSGHIDFKAVLGALRRIEYHGFVSVKVYRHLDLPEAARSSIEYLRGLEAN